MRSRKTTQAEAAEVARRRLEALTAELAVLRGQAEPVTRDGAPVIPPHAVRAGRVAAPVDTPPADARWAAVRGADDVAPAPGRHARRPVSAGSRVGGWLHDRLPPTMQGEVRLRPGHLSVVAMLVAASFALTAWWVARTDGSTTVVPSMSWSRVSEGQPSDPVTPAVETVQIQHPDPTTGGSDPPAEVVVDVAGKVRRPGIATLPLGSRVVDALEAAGGPRRGVDVAGLNLARVLVDGEQIVVGVPPPPGVAAPAASAAAPVVDGAGLMININVATQAELEKLPGVGPVTAAAILDWRAEHGAFTAVEELLEVSGIGEATLADLAPFVTL